MWGAIASVLLGVFGWMFAKLLFEPTKEIVDLRREAQECLILYGDVSKDASSEERTDAAVVFRRVGAGLVSRHMAAYPWVAWGIGRLNWDIHSAGELMISLAQKTQFEGYSHASISPFWPFIRDSLKLPIPKQSPNTRALMENLKQSPHS